MASNNNHEIFQHLDESFNKEIEAKELELKQQVQIELSKKKFVGTPEMQQEVRETELHRLNNIAQNDLTKFETDLEPTYWSEMGGSRDAGLKMVEQEKSNPEFNKQSSEANKYSQPEKLDEAKSDFIDNWRDSAEPSDPDPSIDMDK